MERTNSYPDGNYYAVTWGLTRDHGGMTNAMLHRTRAMVRDSGQPVTIITYEHRDDLDDVWGDLLARGLVIDGMSVVNLWEDLRSWDDSRLRTFADVADATDADHFAPLPLPADGVPPRFAETFRDDGQFLQRDYRRADGTLVVSHRRFTHEGKGVMVTLCDRSGEPIGWLPGVRDFYRFWLDSLPRDPRAFMIIDSKTAANHFPEYRRDDVCTIYMVHGSHLAGSGTDPLGQLSVGRQSTFERLDGFDGVVLLTEAQREDVQVAFGPLKHLHVCPNSRSSGLAPTDLARRPRGRGIALGALVKGKRFSHAIRATVSARRRAARVSLDIFGAGEQREPLQRTIESYRVGRHVRLAGYTSDPLQELSRASFLLMTSNREGFGLVLVEAMSQGCVPIAYDICYGPSDIIEEGVSGFLVEPGDIRGLARAIVRFVRMSSKKRLAMREAAILRASDFSDDQAMQRWAAILTEAWADKQESA